MILKTTYEAETGFAGEWSAAELLRSPHPEIVRMLALWHKAAGMLAYPSKLAFGPTQLRSMLPWVHVYAIAPAAPRFTIRLVGTRMTDFIGRNLSGRSVDDVPIPALRRLAIAMLKAVEGARAPIHAKAPRAVAFPNGDHLSAETIWLPGSEDGTRIDRVVAVSVMGDMD